MNIKASQKLYMQLQEQVEKAEALKQPVDAYIQQQISLLEEIHDSFVKSAIEKNNNITNSLNFAEIQIKQLQVIASLCKKIGISSDKYDKRIHEIRSSYFGADFVNEYFGK